jgi:NAD(P)-dependent dehydrogenase (short-subunit alcohol dehydrogenase family)
MSKIVLVTGGGRGIGRDTALLAAERGWTVAVNYTANRAAAEEVVARIESSSGAAAAFQADVSKVDEVERMFGEIDRRFGRLDGLVNNAGIGLTHGPFEEIRPEHLERTFEVNVFGLVYCSQAAVRRMSTKHGGKGGAIVNISSAASRVGGVGTFIDYAASKAAVDLVTTALAREAGGAGIRVNAVRPGVTATDMLAEADPAWLEDVVKTMPMGRIGQAREISHAVLWLLSEEASYVTGTIVDASGGRAVP